MHCMKYYKSAAGGGGIFLLKSPQKGSAASTTTMGSRRLFNMGTSTGSLVMKRDTFSAGDIPILFSGGQSLGCLVSQHCNKSQMLPYFARSLASTSASQSSGQTPQQEPKKEKWSMPPIHRCPGSYESRGALCRFPGLMVHGMVENSKTRRLLGLNPDTGYFEQEEDVAASVANHDHSLYKLHVPHGHVCRGSAYGWLFLTDDNLDMKLFNPLSGEEIKLPPVKSLPPSENKEDRLPLSKWFVHKAVFSFNPTAERRPVVMVIYGGQHIPRLAFCKPGDEGWTPLEFPIKRHFQWCYVYPKDVIYDNTLFYVLSHPGYVAAFDIGRRIDDDDLWVKTTVVATPPKRGSIYMRDWYLAILDGKLVRFELRTGCFYDCCIEKTKRRIEEERIRDGDTTDEEDYTVANSDETYDFNYADEKDDGRVSPCVDLNLPSLTYGIKIRRFDESEQQLVKVESLGDKAVFLGYNTGFALSAAAFPPNSTQYPLCIPNSIYFTYGSGGTAARTEKVCYDMGIYNVKDKSIKRPLYQRMPSDDDDDASQFTKPAPIWFVKSFNVAWADNGLLEFKMFF